MCSYNKRHHSRRHCYLLLRLLAQSLWWKLKAHLDKYSLSVSTTNNLKDPDSLALVWVRSLASGAGSGEAGHAWCWLMPWKHQLPKARDFNWASAKCKGNGESPIANPSSALHLLLLFAQACTWTGCKDLFNGKWHFSVLVDPGNRSARCTGALQRLWPDKENWNREL